MKICSKCLKQYGNAYEHCPEDGTALTLFDDQATRLAGKVLDGRWLIEKKIGEGGMGEVYQGRQVSVDRPVAIKVLRAAMAVSEEYVARFFREANMASLINHPNFVTIYDFGQAQDLKVLYLAMEFLDGQDLADRMTEGQMGLNHIFQIASQSLGALSAAHEANIVHRDLKPENIFLIGTGPEINLKVLDFGIAKELGSSTKSMTRTGQIFGTPEYMSPEQCQSSADIDGRSDLYSLGCIMYELVVGRSPFLRDSVIQTLMAQVSEELPDLKKFGLSLPDSSADIITKLLEKDPKNRYSSAESAKTAIDAELKRLEASPADLESFMDSQRSTNEFDRHIHSDANTSAYQARPVSQLLDLDEVGALVSKRSKFRTVLPIVVGIGLLGAVSAFAASVAGVFDATELTPASIELGPALVAAGERLDESHERATAAVVSRVGEQTGKATAILATSITLIPPSAQVDTKPKKRKIRKKRDRSALLGVRTSTSIERRARKYQNKLLACYAKREDMDAGGKVSVKFRIKKDGSVDSIKITKAAFKSPAMESCIKAKVAQWQFAESLQGSGINYHQRSFVFKPPK